MISGGRAGGAFSVGVLWRGAQPRPPAVGCCHRRKHRCLAATVTDVALFKSGRQLAAWIGLVPRQNSSGGKDRLGRISKKGDPYLRRLLVVGAHAVLRFSRTGKAPSTRWAADLLMKKPYNDVAPCAPRAARYRTNGVNKWHGAGSMAEH